MKKIKKYQPGTESLYANTGGWNYGFGQNNSKMTNPGNAALKQYTTTSSSSIPDGSLPTSGDISQVAYSKDKLKGPSFKNKAGAFMGNYGGSISSLGTSIAMLINANKKQDPTGRPYKTGTKNLNTNMKKIKYQEGTMGAKPSFESFMSGDIRRTSTGLTPTSVYGTTPAKKAVVRQKPAMTAEMQRVARLQQKMRDAGYNIKVDGAWGKETQKIYDSYIKDKAADASRRSTVNMGQGPLATQPKVAPQAKSNTYNPLDSPVLRQAANDTQARMSKEQAIVDAKARARQAEIARNSQSLPSATLSNRFTFNASDKGQGQDFTTAQDNALKQNKLVGTGATSKNSTRVKTFADGTKKLSGYSKLDSKLGGILPGGVTRAEAKAMKAAKNNPVDSPTDYSLSLGRKPFKPEAVQKATEKQYGGPVSTEKNPILYKEEPAAPAKKSLKQQYEDNKGGYARALKSGKKDAQGNAIDPNTGLAYKILPAKTKGTGGKTTTPSKENPLFKNGVAVKNFKDTKTGRTFYSNGRLLDEKTGRMGKYSHDSKNKKVTIQWDKAKVATPKKRKGDDTYMDEVIDFGSRTIGSIGGAALLGGSTLGVGTVAGAVGGDIAGKKFGNWLNKKLGYREEDDTSQEGYSVGEGLVAGVGGSAGRFIGKAAAPLAKRAGGALVKYATKEGQKIAQAPLGRAVSSVAKSKAGQAVGNVANKAKNAVTGGSKAAAQTTSKLASKANTPGAVSKVAPTLQSSRAAGNLGKVPTKAVRGQRGRFTKNPANTPAKPATVNNQLLTKRGGNTSTPSQTSATPAQGPVLGPAQANLRQSISNKARTVGRKAKETGKKAIKFAKNNKKTTATIGLGGASLLGGGYALSKARTSGK
jgi:hypothetical protein